MSAARTKTLLCCFGIFLGVALLELGLRAGGWYFKARQDAANRRALSSQAEVTIMCLGESTTEGDSSHGNYPTELEKILNSMNVGVRFRVINRGLSGGRTHHIVEALDDNLRTYDPDIVITMMGINDFGQTYAYGGLLGDDSPSLLKELRVYKLSRLISHALLARMGLHDDFMKGRHIQRETSRYPEHLKPISQHDESSPMDTSPEAVSLVHASREADMEIQGLQRLANTGDWSSPGQFDRLLAYYQSRNDEQSCEALYRLRLKYLDSTAFTADRGIFEAMMSFRVQFAMFLEHRGKRTEAEEILLDLVRNVEPGNFRLYPPLISFYEQHNMPERAAQYEAERSEVINSYISPETLKNYDTVRERVLSEGRILIAVQYPTRSLEVLKRLTRYDARVRYVDNEFFTDLIVRDGYDTYFYDRFGVDFGHLTQEGNHLLANHIAHSITPLFEKTSK